jgi:uncharacterized protein
VHVRALHPGDEPAVEAFLFPRLDSSMFLLSNLRNGGLQDSGRRSEGTYVAAFEADEIIAVAALFWTGNIILQAPLHLEAILRELSRLAGARRGGTSVDSPGR